MEVDDATGDADTLVIGWGSTEGTVKAAVRGLRAKGRKVAQANIVHLNPFPPNLGEVLARYQKILVPEMNLGQLVKLLRAEFLVNARSYTKVQGLPFRTDELEAAIGALIDD